MCRAYPPDQYAPKFISKPQDKFNALFSVNAIRNPSIIISYKVTSSMLTKELPILYTKNGVTRLSKKLTRASANTCKCQ